MGYQYPPRLKLSVLESQKTDYIELLPTLNTISDLVKGGNILYKKRREYLKRRPGEEAELYNLRLEKFTYTPVLGNAIRETVSRMATSTLHVSGLPGNDSFWKAFREATDGDKRNEFDLLLKIFRELLQYKSVFVFVDKPSSPVRPRNRREELALGLNPYVVLYRPQEVTNWQPGKWVKIRQIEEVADPFGQNQTIATWTFIDDQSVARYSSPVKLAADGSIKEVLQPPNAENEPTVPLDGEPVVHGYGRLPVIRYELPDELWTANQAYLKALQHLNIENAWTDTAMMAGYVQRLFQPLDPVPDGDIHTTYEDDERSSIVSDNAHILVGKQFKFNEIQGSCLETLSEHVLKEIVQQIRGIISLGGLSGTKGALEQSGLSKSFDYAQFNDSLKGYGKSV